MAARVRTKLEERLGVCRKSLYSLDYGTSSPRDALSYGFPVVDRLQLVFIYVIPSIQEIKRHPSRLSPDLHNMADSWILLTVT